jgi:hypothetical protein
MLHPKDFVDVIRKLFERTMRVNLEGFWRPIVADGFGLEAHHQDGDRVLLIPASTEYTTWIFQLLTTTRDSCHTKHAAPGKQRN